MATMNNSIKQLATPAMPEKKAGLVEYESNGEKVQLTPDTVRKYLVNGGGEVTDQEVLMYLSLCRYQKLNPFLKECYLIKYGSSPATIVAGKDVFTKRAMKNPNYEGKQAGVVVITEGGMIIEREGAVVMEGEKLVGGWAKVYIKGYKEPEYASVSFEEYAGKTKDGKLNSQWASKPATMIRKVALVQALREAFPDNFEGLYAPEEIPEGNNILNSFEIPEKGIPVARPEQPEVIEGTVTETPEEETQGGLFD